MNDKPRMAPEPDAPAGLEQDSKGDPITFEQRTEEDKAKVREAVAEAIHGKPSVHTISGEDK